MMVDHGTRYVEPVALSVSLYRQSYHFFFGSNPIDVSDVHGIETDQCLLIWRVRVSKRICHRSRMNKKARETSSSRFSAASVSGVFSPICERSSSVCIRSPLSYSTMLIHGTDFAESRGGLSVTAEHRYRIVILMSDCGSPWNL